MKFGEKKMLYFTITSITFQTPKRVEMARVVPADLKPCYLSKNAFFFLTRFIQGGSFVNFLKVTTLVSTLVSLFLWPLIWPLILVVRPCGEPELPRRGRDHRRVPRHDEQLRCWTESLSGLSIDLSNLICLNLCPPPSYPQPCTTYTLRPVLPTFSPDLSSDFSSDFSSVPHLTPHLTSPP